MKIAGNYTFAATRQEVWDALNDPEVLARTIPGCQRLDQVGENEYESTLKIGLQAVRGIYTGRVKIDNLQPPASYEIHVDGKGTNGFLKGSGGIILREDGANALLEYSGEAQIGGTIASVGQRLIDGAAKTLINQSLKALSAQIEARRANLTPPAPEPTSTTPEPTPTAPPEPTPADAPEPAAAATITPEPVATPRRTIHVPSGEGLSEVDVARGVVTDFLRDRPWLPWVVASFVLGFLLGRLV